MDFVNSRIHSLYLNNSNRRESTLDKSSSKLISKVDHNILCNSVSQQTRNIDQLHGMVSAVNRRSWKITYQASFNSNGSDNIYHGKHQETMEGLMQSLKTLIVKCFLIPHIGYQKIYSELTQQISDYRITVKRPTRNKVAKNQEKGKKKMLKPEIEIKNEEGKPSKRS